MLKKSLLGYVSLLFVLISCGKKQEIATYMVDGAKKKTTVSQAMDELRPLFGQVDPQEMLNVIANPEILKLVIQSRLIEPEIMVVEAQTISNFLEDESYQQSLKNQENSLLLQSAFQAGQEKIAKEVGKTRMDIAEISRIMITNASLLADNMSTADVLAQIQNAEDPSQVFASIAQQYSQEPLGQQNGGYLGHVFPGRFAMLDDVVFKQKHDGLYENVISDEFGEYIVYVHTPAKKIKVADFDKEGIALPQQTAELAYINSNTETMFEFTADSNVIVVNKKEVALDDLKDSQLLAKIWGKKYTLKSLKESLSSFLQESKGGELSTTEEVFGFLTPSQGGIGGSVLLRQIAYVEKGNKKSIASSKDFKNQLIESKKSFQLENAYNVVSQELFQNLSTNVSPQELQEFYAVPENRQVKSYKNDGTPIYQTLNESKDVLTQQIVGKRAEELQNLFRAQLIEDYQIAWDETNFTVFVDTLQEEFNQFMADSEAESSSIIE